MSNEKMTEDLKVKSLREDLERQKRRKNKRKKNIIKGTFLYGLPASILALSFSVFYMASETLSEAEYLVEEKKREFLAYQEEVNQQNKLIFEKEQILKEALDEKDKRLEGVLKPSTPVTTGKVIKPIEPIINTEPKTFEKSNSSKIKKPVSDVEQKQNKPSPPKKSPSNETESGNKPIVPTEPTAPSEPLYEPNVIIYDNEIVEYTNGGVEKGQEIIDTTHLASTWGGVQKFSGTDGKNTHFIGYSGDVFQFRNIENAETFIVTDEKGRGYKYKKEKVYEVDKDGIDKGGVNRTDRIVGEDGGERIVIQTIKDANHFLIIEAVFIQDMNL